MVVDIERGSESCCLRGPCRLISENRDPVEVRWIVRGTCSICASNSNPRRIHSSLRSIRIPPHKRSNSRGWPDKQSSTHDPSSVSAAAEVPAGIASAVPGEDHSTSAGLEVGHRIAVGEHRSSAADTAALAGPDNNRLPTCLLL